MDKTLALQVFQSLASRQRLELYCLLARAGAKGMVAGEAARALGVSATNLSFHLRTMREAGLVTVESEGRYVRYRANDARVHGVLDFLERRGPGRAARRART